MSQVGSALAARRAGAGDLGAVIDVVAAALAWDPEQPNEAFFRWKHLENPFGPSPMWLAEMDGQVIGVRAFMRWRFRRPDGSIATAVRAVDTATHPDHRGLGVFRTLTMHALEELREEGVDFVFNTPNDKSRPGYLKMGWHQIGRVPVRARIASWRSLPRMPGARAVAQKWSEPATGAPAAEEILADESAIAETLAAIPPRNRYTTDRTPEYLRWRYRFAPLAYRAIALDDDPRRGLAIFRVRRRGSAREATLAELLVPGDHPETTLRLLAEVRRAAGADYVLHAGRSLPARAGFVPVPKSGPILTWRAIAQDRCPPLASWDLSVGDVELF